MKKKETHALIVPRSKFHKYHKYHLSQSTSSLDTFRLSILPKFKVKKIWKTKGDEKIKSKDSKDDKPPNKQTKQKNT